jgi:hypothetical protein
MTFRTNVYLQGPFVLNVIDPAPHEATPSSRSHITQSERTGRVGVEEVSEDVECLRTAVERAGPEKANLYAIGGRPEKALRVSVGEGRGHALHNRVWDGARLLPVQVLSACRKHPRTENQQN